MAKKILIIAIAAFLVLGSMPIPLVPISPPEAEAGKYHFYCRWIISTDYIGIYCEWETHDH